MPFDVLNQNRIHNAKLDGQYQTFEMKRNNDLLDLEMSRQNGIPIDVTVDSITHLAEDENVNCLGLFALCSFGQTNISIKVPAEYFIPKQYFINLENDQRTVQKLTPFQMSKRYLERHLGAPISVVVTKLKDDNLDKEVFEEMIREARNNGDPTFIASRLAAMEAIRKRTYFAKNPKDRYVEGSIVTGMVTAVSYNVMKVDVGGAEVTVNRSNAAHAHIPDLRERFNVGDVVAGKITDIQVIDDSNDIHVSYSIKDAEPDPYSLYGARIHKGDSLTGRVVYVYDATKGVNGSILANVERYDVTVACRFPSGGRRPHVGDNVLIKIRENNPEKRRIYGHIMNATPQ